MSAGIIEIAGVRYYTYVLGWLLVAPFVLLFFASLLRIWVRFAVGKRVTWSLTVFSVVCVLGMTVAIFWDVYFIGQQATRLCNENAGLHVYRTAEAQSFLGGFDIKYWSTYGFEFVEKDGSRGKTRYFYKNGEKIYQKVEQFVSRYELVTTRERLTPKIDLLRVAMKDRQTDEVLGESIEYSIDGGWADMLFYGLTGFSSYSPWICTGKENNEPRYLADVVTATLKPVIRSKQP